MSNDEIIFLFKSFLRPEHGIHILDALGKPKCSLTNSMEYYSDYISGNFKNKYPEKKIKKIRKKNVLILCAEYPERSESNYEDLAKFIPIRYAKVSKVKPINGNFLVKLKLRPLSKYKSISADEYTSKIRKQIGDDNLPLWYKCGANNDQTQFHVATIGIDNYSEEVESKNDLSYWESKVNELFTLIENSRNYIFYYLESISKEGSTKNLLKCRFSRVNNRLKLKSNTKYEINLIILIYEENKWKSKDLSEQPYITLSSQENLIIPEEDKVLVRTDTTRQVPIELKFRTSEKNKEGDILIKFGPDQDKELKKSRISLPFKISRRWKYILFLLFIIFIAVDVTGNMVLNFYQDLLSLELQIIFNLMVTFGTIGSFILLYRKRIL